MVYLEVARWLDYAKRNTNFPALQYAALALRHGIEQLWFETIIGSVGGRLDRKEYVRCKSDATKKYKIIRRLLSRLMRLHGESSEYLHFCGAPAETTQDRDEVI